MTTSDRLRCRARRVLLGAFPVGCATLALACGSSVSGSVSSEAVSSEAVSSEAVSSEAVSSEAVSPEAVSTSTSVPETASSAPTSQAAPSTTEPAPVPNVAAPREIVFVGDSVARQFFEAAVILAEDRVELRYLISAGPAFGGEDWAGTVGRFIPEPDAMIVSFGTWQATPPPDAADRVVEDEIATEIQRYLAVLAQLDLQRTPTLLVRPSVAEAVANDRLQWANDATRPIARSLGFDVYDITEGDITEGEPASTGGARVVLGDGSVFALRDGVDATHYCPAAALVIARTALGRQGIALDAVSRAHVPQLERATAGAGLFATTGCEQLGR